MPVFLFVCLLLLLIYIMSLTVSRRSNVNNFHSAIKQQIIVNYTIGFRTVLKWMVICAIWFQLNIQFSISSSFVRHQINTSTLLQMIRIKCTQLLASEMENQACQSVSLGFHNCLACHIYIPLSIIQQYRVKMP